MSETNARRAELQKALQEVIAEQDAVIEAAARAGESEGIDFDFNDEKQAAFAKSTAKVVEIQALLGAIDENERAKSWGREPEGQSIAALVAAIEAGQRVPTGSKSIGQRFVESDEFKVLGGGHNLLTMPQAFTVSEMDLPGLGRKDVYSDLPTGFPTVFGTVQRDAMVTLPQRRPRIRDLFPAQGTTSSIIEYFEQTGFTNSASVVPERTSNAFTAKPQSTFTFVGKQTSTRTIAHWEAAHRNVLEDEPQLRALIDSELLYGLQLREDDQILNGTGTGEDLPGILTNASIQTYAQSSGPSTDNGADAVRRAITKSMIALFPPSGVVVHPSDWESMELVKSTTGEYLLATSIALGGPPQVWRIPVVESLAITAKTALVGAFGTGAQLYDRAQASIRVAEQHSDFFTRNAVVVLAEERLALACKRPQSFVKVTLS